MENKYWTKKIPYFVQGENRRAVEDDSVVEEVEETNDVVESSRRAGGFSPMLLILGLKSCVHSYISSIT